MDEIIEKIRKAYLLLIKYDAHLLIYGANERSITHKLAQYLEPEFPEYHIDCEYNLNGVNPKMIHEFRREILSDDTDAVCVYPDIIIHHRGTNDNFIVIEAKKSSNKNKDDYKKLEMYKNDLHYQFAFFLIFPVGDDFKKIEIPHIDHLIQPI